MVMSGAKSRRFADFDTQHCVQFLRALYPFKTAQQVSADTFIPTRTVERWLAGQATPNGVAMVVLIVTYGPAFIHACVPGLPWVEEALLRLEAGRLEQEIDRLRHRSRDVAARLEARG